MADDINNESGGTQGDEQEYTKESVEKMIQEAAEKARKEGETQAHQHWQGIADKKISEVNKIAEERLSKYEEELSTYRKQRFETMTPEEQQAAMIKELYERNTKEGEKTSSEGKSQDTDTKPAGFDEDPRVAARKQITPVLEELGLDVSKVDWADDTQGPEAMKRFVQSIVAQQKPAEETKTQTEEEKEAERVNASRSMGKTDNDILKMNPRDLVIAGLKEDKPSRMRV